MQSLLTRVDNDQLQRTTSQWRKQEIIHLDNKHPDHHDRVFELPRIKFSETIAQEKQVTRTLIRETTEIEIFNSHALEKLDPEGKILDVTRYLSIIVYPDKKLITLHQLFEQEKARLGHHIHDNDLLTLAYGLTPNMIQKWQNGENLTAYLPTQTSRKKRSNRII